MFLTYYIVGFENLEGTHLSADLLHLWRVGWARGQEAEAQYLHRQVLFHQYSVFKTLIHTSVAEVRLMQEARDVLLHLFAVWTCFQSSESLKQKAWP